MVRPPGGRRQVASPDSPRLQPYLPHGCQHSTSGEAGTAWEEHVDGGVNMQITVAQFILACSRLIPTESKMYHPHPVGSSPGAPAAHPVPKYHAWACLAAKLDGTLSIHQQLRVLSVPATCTTYSRRSVHCDSCSAPCVVQAHAASRLWVQWRHCTVSHVSPARC